METVATTSVDHKAHATSSFDSTAVLAPENYAQLSNEYIKKRYRRKYENPDKIRELMQEQKTLVDNLRTAVEGKMDVAATGILQDILLAIENGAGLPPSETQANNPNIKLVEDAGDRQRALNKADICPAIIMVLRDLGGQAQVCEKALHCVAYLCRYSDENKTSVCLENAKGFGVNGISDLIVGAIKRHKDSQRVMEASCDAIRSLCSLESNRERLAAAGACEAVARALTKYASSPETICWICRAMGHLANNSEENRELFCNAGACETIMVTLQKYPSLVGVCTEVCWAIRQLALFEKNKTRLMNDFVVESIMAVYKFHMYVEPFAQESTHALANLISSDEDEAVQKIANANFISFASRSLKRNQDSENLARWIFQVYYYIAGDDRWTSSICTREILELLSNCLENHAGVEAFAEWGCRFTERILTSEEISARMRSAGLCEMITSAVQRQAISPVVASIGCLTVGKLARDLKNQPRLSSAGACEAVVGALKRHYTIVEVAYTSCFAIHYLCKTQNNVSWMGAYGACDAVTQALQKHNATSEEVAKHAANAIGSLAHKDEGNQDKLFKAGACLAIVDALTIHGNTSFEVAEYACRAIFNLCADNNNVSELGKHGACALVVNVLQTHFGHSSVLAQALLAVYSLAVKGKIDKVHKGNTRKFVEKGALEVILAAMQKFIDKEDVQRAAGMAISSLARMEPNKLKLGSLGACELIVQSFKAHCNSAAVVGKLALAVDSLSLGCDENKNKFTSMGIVQYLLKAFETHIKNESVVADLFRTIVTLSTVTSNQDTIFHDTYLKLYVRALRDHEASAKVARYGCNMMYAAATTNALIRKELGQNARAGEIVITLLGKHGEKDHHVAEWCCKAIVSLSLYDPNKEKFHNHEACQAVAKALAAHPGDSVVVEWSMAAIVSMAMFTNNRTKLYRVHVCPAICAALAKQREHEAIVRLSCEAIYELALTPENQKDFDKCGVVNILSDILTQHHEKVQLVSHICRAISTACANSEEIAKKFMDVNVGVLIVDSMKAFVTTSPQLTQWSCAAITSLCSSSGHSKSKDKDGKSDNNNNGITGTLLHTSSSSNNVPSTPGGNTLPTTAAALTKFTHQTFFGNQALELLANAFVTHKSNPATTGQVVRCLRALAFQHKENQIQIGKNTTILPTCLEVIKLHLVSDLIIEHGCWLVGSIEFRSSSWNKVNLNKMKKALLSSALQNSSSKVTNEIDNTMSEKKKNSMDGDFDSASYDASNDPFETPSRKNTTDTPVMSPTTNETSSTKNVSPKDFYQSTANWDILHRALKTNMQRSAQLRWICASIAIFAEIGKLSHADICETLMEILEKEVSDDLVLQKLFTAVGALAKNSENNDRFVSGNICETIEQVITAYTENTVVLIGILAAVTGLADQRENVQNRFNRLTTFAPSIISLLYNELETEAISQYSCAAITSLVKNHLKNKLKFHALCNYIADVLTTHKYNAVIALEGCRTISHLAHQCITNRNRLGSSDTCQAVVIVLQHHIDHDINLSLMKAFTINTNTNAITNTNTVGKNQQSQSLLFWSVRAIADLAANHPNNQTRLGNAGACELLVKLLRRPSHPGEFIHEMKFFAAVFWAIGNVAQTNAKNTANEATNVATANFMNRTSSLASSAHTGGGNSALGASTREQRNANIFHTKQVKISTRFFEAGVVSATLQLLQMSLNPPSTAVIGSNANNNAAFITAPFLMWQWALRSLINLSNSSRLKGAFIEEGAIEVVQEIILRIESSRHVITAANATSILEGVNASEVLEWANNAKDTLNAMTEE